jgi:hypothetical protein
MKTTKEERRELIAEFTKTISGPIGKLQLLFIIAIFASIFVFIWGESSNGWKTLLTGLIGTILLGIINYFWVKFATKLANDEMDKIDIELEKEIPKSRFQERLAEMQKQKEYKREGIK